MNALKRRIENHLHASWWVYLLVFFFFIAGLLFGSIGVNVLEEKQLLSLGDFLEEGFAVYDNGINYVLSTKQAVARNLFNQGKILLLGLTVIGFPVVLIIIFSRGFALGFTVVFLIKQKAFRGLLLTLFAVLPPALLSLPAYVLAAVSAFNFSLFLLKGANSQNGTPTGEYFWGYISVMVLIAVLLICSAFIEGYLSAFVIRLLS